MSRSVTIDANINDSQAKVKLNAMEQQLEKLKLAATGIKITYDKDGNVLSQIVKETDAFGRLLTTTTRWHDIVNESGEVINRTATVTQTVTNNLEKQAKQYEQINKQKQKALELEQKQAQLDQRRTQDERQRMLEQVIREREAKLQRERQAKLDDYRNRMLGADTVMSSTREWYHQQYAKEWEAMLSERDRQSNARAAQIDAANYAEQMRQAAAAEAEFINRNRELSSSLDVLHGAFDRIAGVAVRKLRQSFREAFEEMKNVDSELVVVRKVTDASAEELEELSDRAYKVGKSYGVAASDYLSSVAEFSRAGYKDQSADLAELAVKLQLVGDVSQDTANQFLIATDKAYGLKGNVEELSSVIDQLNEIDNNFATSIQKMADGMGIIAPIASQAHVSIAELESALGTITATTQRSGAESARALRALFLNIMGDTKTEIEDGATWTAGEIEGLRDVLNLYAKDAVEAAEASGEVINPMKAIAALADSYKSGVLTEARLMEMVSDIGGKLRSSQLMALIQNWDMYEQMLEKTEEAAGSADKEVSRALDSWERKVEILKNTWTDFIQKSLDSNTIKGVLDFVTKAIESFGDLGTVIGFLAAFQIPNLVSSFGMIGTAVNNIATWTLQLGGGFKELVAVVTNFGSLSKSAAQGSEQLASSLQNINVGASAAAAGIGAAIAIIAVAKIAWDAYQRKLDETIATGEQTAKELKNIESLYDKWEELNQTAANTKAAEDARQALVDKLKDEGVWVDTITGKYGSLEEKIKGATEAAKNNRQVELLDAQKAARTKILQGESDSIFSLYDDADYFISGSTRYTRGSFFDQIFAEAPTVEQIVDLYQKAVEKRGELLSQGEYGSNADKALERFINYYKDSVETYIDLKNALDALNGSTEKTEEVSNAASESAEKQAESFIGLKDEVEAATKALENYNKALEGGEKGDTLKQYAEVYKQAKKLFEGGYYGSTQYKAALDLLLPDEKKQELRYDYKALGEYVFEGFASGAYEALYGSGGEDFGAVLATYLRDNADGMESIYEVINDNGKSFDLLIHDEDALAEQLGMTTEQVYAFMDALDIHHSDIMLSSKDVQELVKKYGDLSKGVITDGVGLVKQLVDDGRTEGEIRNIIDQLDRAGQIEMKSLPEDLSAAIQQFQEINEAAKDLPKEAVVEIKTNPESGYFDKVYAEINTLNGKKVVIGVSYKVDGTAASPYYPTAEAKSKYPTVKINVPVDEYGANWQGVTSATAGTSVLNEEGAELIVRGRKAFIANDGKPTLFDLKTGDKVFNAEETEDILSSNNSKDWISNSASKLKSMGGSNAYQDWISNSASKLTEQAAVSAFAGGIPVTRNDKTNGGGGGGGGGKDSKQDVKDSELLSMLDDYISEMLDKAKKALDAQIDAIDAQIEKLKAEHDAEEEANELEELRLKILEAEKKLVDANVERTVRYFNKATGQWEWMADQKAVAEAQKSLEDAQKAYYDKLADIEYQAKLDELQAQKDALNENYDNLSDTWSEIKDEISKALSEKDVLELAEILTRLGLTAASGSVGGVNTLISDIDTFTGSFDNGGFALGKGLLRKATSKTETVLDDSITDRILSPRANAQFTSFTNSLSRLFGMSTGDIGAKAKSLFSTIDRSSSVVGDTYYINGVQIGSDMLDRPLSEVLSVLPIYAG